MLRFNHTALRSAAPRNGRHQPGGRMGVNYRRGSMLVRFTIEGGCIPVTEQAREDLLNEYLRLLADYDPDAEDHIRKEIRQHLNSHTQFTAAWIACDGPNSWRQEFHPLYHAIERVATDAQTAHDESGKFLGLLVWNEA